MSEFNILSEVGGWAVDGIAIRYEDETFLYDAGTFLWPVLVKGHLTGLHE